MENLPKDPDILLSFLNMKLRDSYSTIEEMCDDMDWDKDDFSKLLADAGLEYFSEGGRFVKI